jgi:arylformamidase
MIGRKASIEFPEISMHGSFRRRLLLSALLGSAALPVQAGPIADWLRERKAAKDNDTGEDLDDGSTAGGSRNAFQPPAGIDVQRDLAYGSDPAQRLDVYRPTDRKASGPILIMVHGGGWRRGDKGGTSMVGNKVRHWVEKGWVFVSINYRLVPQVTPVQQVDDLAAALAHVQANAAKWGADAEQVVLMGHSAGAHLVALLTSDGSPAKRAGARPWRATVAIDSAALDVVSIMERRHFGLYDTAFGSDPALWRDASPIHRLTARPAAPMLLVCSSRRDDSCSAAEQYAKKARSLDGQVQVLPIALNHAKINADLGEGKDYTSAVDNFFRGVGL